MRRQLQSQEKNTKTIINVGQVWRSLGGRKEYKDRFNLHSETKKEKVWLSFEEGERKKYEDNYQIRLTLAFIWRHEETRRK